MLRAYTVMATLQVAAVAIAVPFGPAWVAIAISATTVCVQLPVQIMIVCREGPVDLRFFLSIGVPLAVAAIFASALTMTTRLMLETVDAAVFLALACAVALLATLLVLLTFRQTRDVLTNFRSIKSLIGSS